MIDPDSGARGAIRDSRRSGAERFLWTLVVFGSHQWAAGRTEELGNARSQAEADAGRAQRFGQIVGSDRYRRNPAVHERSSEGPRSTPLRPSGTELKTFGTAILR
jgi:hypothetical protein